uniref:Uncharacterized protein n=1 Tax=viral metagenome TaxID=1070528 RepID=A0A6M3IG76_9ZZZZ
MKFFVFFLKGKDEIADLVEVEADGHLEAYDKAKTTEDHEYFRVFREDDQLPESLKKKEKLVEIKEEIKEELEQKESVEEIREMKRRGPKRKSIKIIKEEGGNNDEIYTS